MFLFIFLGSAMSSSDAGFCSGSSENGEDMLSDHPRSPTDASEDSIEMKVMPIALPSKNKRKSSEPFKLISSDTDSIPIKKRICYDVRQEAKRASATLAKTIKKEDSHSQSNDSTGNHFRPWIAPAEEDSSEYVEDRILNPAEILQRHPGVTTLHRIPQQTKSQLIDDQDQPLALVSKKSSPPSTSSSPVNTLSQSPSKLHQMSPLEMMSNSLQQQGSPLKVPNLDLSTTSSTSSSHLVTPSGRSTSQHRNYKNMTRERRIEANARERTRVHTISAAFDTLRKSIPSYSNNQKLSKLSILRISCQYILLLSRVAGMDYSADNSEPSLSECMEHLTRTIQTEGKLRKKKDE